MTETKSTQAASRWFEWGARLLLVALVVHSLNIRERVAGIESNRFTNKEAAEMERRILAKVPPPEVDLGLAVLKEGQAEIKALLRDMDKRLRDVETRVK